jgi:uncharacterized protein (TIGR00725 family)
MSQRIVTVFGSGFPKEGSEEYAAAYDLGRLLAHAGYVICNGGYAGIMEASARGAKDAGGTTIGVVTEVFGTEANRYIDKKIVVRTHAERLLKLIELGDAYIALRGGTGTLVELATVWEYINKRLLPEKPLIAVGDCWKKVIDIVADELQREGRGRSTTYITSASSVKEAMRILADRVRP